MTKNCVGVVSIHLCSIFILRQSCKDAFSFCRQSRMYRISCGTAATKTGCINALWYNLILFESEFLQVDSAFSLELCPKCQKPRKKMRKMKNTMYKKCWKISKSQLKTSEKRWALLLYRWKFPWIFPENSELFQMSAEISRSIVFTKSTLIIHHVRMTWQIREQGLQVSKSLQKICREKSNWWKKIWKTVCRSFAHSPLRLIFPPIYFIQISKFNCHSYVSIFWLYIHRDECKIFPPKFLVQILNLVRFKFWKKQKSVERDMMYLEELYKFHLARNAEAVIQLSLHMSEIESRETRRFWFPRWDLKSANATAVLNNCALSQIIVLVSNNWDQFIHLIYSNKDNDVWWRHQVQFQEISCMERRTRRRRPRSRDLSEFSMKFL